MTLALRPAQTRATRDRPRIAIRTRPVAAQETDCQPLADQPNPRFESKARRRELLNLLRVKNAAKHLDHMPPPGCSIHGIMRGNYSFCDLIPAVLTLIAPQTLTYVAATTLGFSQKAILQILDLLDSRGVARFDFVCADFFAKSDPEVTQFARAELQRRGSQFAAARCHAKILLFATTVGDHYTSESSANIRACRSIEQFALTNDRELFEFHRAWIQEVLNAPEETNKA